MQSEGLNRPDQALSELFLKLFKFHNPSVPPHSRQNIIYGQPPQQQKIKVTSEKFAPFFNIHVCAQQACMRNMFFNLLGFDLWFEHLLWLYFMKSIMTKTITMLSNRNIYTRLTGWVRVEIISVSTYKFACHFQPHSHPYSNEYKMMNGNFWKRKEINVTLDSSFS